MAILSLIFDVPVPIESARRHALMHQEPAFLDYGGFLRHAAEHYSFRGLAYFKVCSRAQSKPISKSSRYHDPARLIDL